MNTLIVNKTEQTATEQLFYFPGIPPPRHLRRINNRLVVENHKTLMGSALQTICKTEVRRSWPGTWFCHALPEHPPPRPGRARWHSWLTESSGAEHVVFCSWAERAQEEQERVTSPVPQHPRQSARDSKLPQRRGKAALFFPSLLPHPPHSQGRLKPWNNANKSMNWTKSKPENKEWTISCHSDKNNK